MSAARIMFLGPSGVVHPRVAYAVLAGRCRLISSNVIATSAPNLYTATIAPAYSQMFAFVMTWLKAIHRDPRKRYLTNLSCYLERHGVRAAIDMRFKIELPATCDYLELPGDVANQRSLRNEIFTFVRGLHASILTLKLVLCVNDALTATEPHIVRIANNSFVDRFDTLDTHLDDAIYAVQGHLQRHQALYARLTAKRRQLEAKARAGSLQALNDKARNGGCSLDDYWRAERRLRLQFR